MSSMEVEEVQEVRQEKQVETKLSEGLWIELNILSKPNYFKLVNDMTRFLVLKSILACYWL